MHGIKCTNDWFRIFISLATEQRITMDLCARHLVVVGIVSLPQVLLTRNERMLMHQSDKVRYGARHECLNSEALLSLPHYISGSDLPTLALMIQARMHARSGI